MQGIRYYIALIMAIMWNSVAHAALPAACSAWQAQSPVYQKFLAENPDLQRISPEERILLMKIRSFDEWDYIGGYFASFGATGFPVQSEWGNFRDANNITQSQFDRGKNLSLPASNPLMAAQDSLEALYQWRSGKPELAFSAAQRSLASPGNSNTIAYFVAAQVSLENDHFERAIEYANLGIALIKRMPTRSQATAGYHAALLRLLATATQRKSERAGVAGVNNSNLPAMIAGWETNANTIAETGRTQFMSPFADFGSLVPGLQPLVRANWKDKKRLLAIPADAISQFAMAALVFPEPPPQQSPVIMATGQDILRTVELCSKASEDAIVIGDFASAARARRIVFDALSPNNADKVLGLIAGAKDETGEEFDGAVENLNGVLGCTDAGSPSFALSMAVVDGDFFLLTRRLAELASDPRGSKLFDGIIDRLEKSDSAPDSATLKAVRKKKKDILAAIRHVSNLLAGLSAGPVDSKSLDEAFRWFSGGGVDNLMPLMMPAEAAPAKGALSDEQKAMSKTLKMALPVAAATIGWSRAAEQGDFVRRRKFELALLDGVAAQLARTDQKVFKGLSREFSILRNDSASRVEQLRATEAVLTAGINSLFPKEDEEDAEYDAPVGDIITAWLLIPQAADLHQWDLVNKLGAKVLDWYSKGGRADLEDQQEMMNYVGGGAIAALVEAKLKTRSAVEAEMALDLFMPDLRGRDRSDPEWIAATMMAPDSLAEQGVMTKLAARKEQEALAIAQWQVEKYGQYSRPPVAISPTGAPLEIVDQRKPYEQLFDVARHVDAKLLPWDDLVSALNNGRKSEAGDAMLLRAAAQVAGKDSMEAYDAMVALEAEATGMDALTLQVVNAKNAAETAYSSQQKKTLDYVASRQKFYASLPEDLRARLVNQATLEGIRSSLKPDELVIATQVSRGSVALVAIEKNGPPVLSWATISYPELQQRVTALNKAMTLPATYERSQIKGPDNSQLEAIYNGLLAGLDQKIRRARHIIWSPDLRLAQVPLAALASSQGFDSVTGKTPYLGLAKSISFTPKLSAFSYMRKTGSAMPEGAIALGDISYSGEVNPSGSMAGSLAFRDFRFAKPVMEDFGSKTRAVMLKNNNASLSGLNGLPRSEVGMMLFYTHGIAARGSQPAMLALAGNGGDAIGFLKPADVMAMPPSARYVLLAACSTGSSASEALQPYGGLVSSFLARGSRAVLTAQQPVDEASTATLMATMVSAMKANQPPSDALRSAMAEIAGNPGTSNPVWWAQFVWVGDGG